MPIMKNYASLQICVSTFLLLTPFRHTFTEIKPKEWRWSLKNPKVGEIKKEVEKKVDFLPPIIVQIINKAMSKCFQ